MAFLTAACAALLLIFSGTAMQAASRAAQVFVSGVLPALFPMMVLGRLLPARSKGERSRFPWLAVPFGLASGSPASAQRAWLLWDSGAVDTAQAQRLLCATGVMSPLFFTGTLAAWTGRPAACAVLLGAHWAGALLCACLWRPGAADTPRQSSANAMEKQRAVTLPEAISQSAQALLCVCGAMMLFSIAAALLRELLMLACPVWTQKNGRLLAVLWALLEIGGGASAVLEAYEAPPFALLCALCSFGGLSIWLQNLLFARPIIHPAKLLGMRALHAVVSYGLCRLALCWFAQPTFAAPAPHIATGTPLGPLYTLLALYLCSRGFLKIQNLLIT